METAFWEFCYERTMKKWQEGIVGPLWSLLTLYYLLGRLTIYVHTLCFLSENSIPRPLSTFDIWLSLTGLQELLGILDTVTLSHICFTYFLSTCCLFFNFSWSFCYGRASDLCVHIRLLSILLLLFIKYHDLYYYFIQIISFIVM